MSYTPTNWKAGDVVTSAKLNKMEQGIAASGGIRIVHMTQNNDQSLQLDITPNELINAFENEEIVVAIGQGSSGGSSSFQSLISRFYYDETTYEVTLSSVPAPLTSSDPDITFGYIPESSGNDNPWGGNVSQ